MELRFENGWNNWPFGHFNGHLTEMPNVGFKDNVWPKFLRENALRVLKIN